MALSRWFRGAHGRWPRTWPWVELDQLARRVAPRGSFTDWRKARPFWAGVWAILGGAIVAVGPATGVRFLLLTSGTISIGIAVGLLIALLGLLLWVTPSLRYLLGGLIILFSFVSFSTSDFGGLLLGMLLGLVGGSLAVAWTPVQVVRSGSTEGEKRVNRG